MWAVDVIPLCCEANTQVNCYILKHRCSIATIWLCPKRERIQNPPHFFVMVSSWYHHGRPRQVSPQVTPSYLESYMIYSHWPRLRSFLICETNLPFYIKWRKILLHSPLINSFNQFKNWPRKLVIEMSHLHTQFNHRMIRQWILMLTITKRIKLWLN